MIYTFYSYKGGVGRSMALVNVAELLYRAGLRVLMVDWDLEAPGLERFFPSAHRILDRPGLIELLLRYKEQAAKKPPGTDSPGTPPFELPDDYLVELYPAGSNGGQLWLLPAGRRAPPHFKAYARAVRTLDWQDFYANWAGDLYFEWLRHHFARLADVVLIDSRTGVTEMGGICTYQLADVVVMFCAANQQNLEGTSAMAANFMSEEVQEQRPDRPLQVIIVPARVEDRAENELLDRFSEQFRERTQEFVPANVEGGVDAFWELKIPYVPYYAFSELVAVREGDRAGSTDLTRAFVRLLWLMIHLAARTPSSGTNLRRAVDHLLGDAQHVASLPPAWLTAATALPPPAVIETEPSWSGSEQFSEDQRGRVVALLAALPSARTVTGRAGLIAGLPSYLRDSLLLEGSSRTVMARIVDSLIAFGELEDGQLALVRLLESARETVSGSALSQEIQDILRTLDRSGSRVSHQRDVYSTYLQERFKWVDPRGLVPPEHTGLLSIRVPLVDIYVPRYAKLISSQSAAIRGESGITRSAAHGMGVNSAPSREHNLIDQLISTSQVVILLGDPGTGKSAFLRRQALQQLAEPNGPLPVWVPLSAFAAALEDQPTLRIHDYAVAYYEGITGYSLAPLFSHASRNGSAVYLLDGLDEVPHEWRNIVSDRVAELAESIRGTTNKLVVTSRVVGYIPLRIGSYVEAVLEPLGSDQINHFVRKWCQLIFEHLIITRENAHAAANRLLRVIDEDKGVRKLADNPLTLTMMILFFAGNRDLPRHRIRLYGLITRTLIEEWRKARSGSGMPVGTRFQESDVIRQVGALAYWMQDERPEGLVTQAELERLLVRVERGRNPDEDPLPGVRRFLDQLSHDVGIISPKGAGLWGFSHLAFQEYFAAREIVRWREGLIASELTKRAVDPRWAEVIRLCIAYIGLEFVATELATSLVKDIFLMHEDPADTGFPHRILLAGRVVADEPGIDRPVAVEVARRVYAIFKNTHVDALRDEAGAVLLELLDTTIRPLILNWLAETMSELELAEAYQVMAANSSVVSSLLKQLPNE